MISQIAKKQQEEFNKRIEAVMPQEMTLGRDNPFLKIMYDHAPNNAKFYEDNVDRVNKLRGAIEPIKELFTASHLSIIDSEITRLEGEVEEMAHDGWNEIEQGRYQVYAEEISYLKEQRAILEGNK